MSPRKHLSLRELAQPAMATETLTFSGFQLGQLRRLLDSDNTSDSLSDADSRAVCLRLRLRLKLKLKPCDRDSDSDS